MADSYYYPTRCGKAHKSHNGEPVGHECQQDLKQFEVKFFDILHNTLMVVKVSATNTSQAIINAAKIGPEGYFQMEVDEQV